MSIESARPRSFVFDPPAPGPVWLASRSPRRARLLADAGVPVRTHTPPVDDGHLVPGRVTPRQWVSSLAWFKGRAVADVLRAGGPRAGSVLAADTICVHQGRILGQPRDAADARSMLERFQDDAHVTMTGVCVIALRDLRRWFAVDEAEVRVGRLGADAIDAYVASGEWMGKAGAYNLEDRRDAGWDIRCNGDPATVMGLPMTLLEPWLRRLREVNRT